MDRRLPYDSPGGNQPRQQPPGVGNTNNNMSPMDIEEALFYQRRHEFQRDLQLRQMLIQEQIDHQNSLHQQRMYELQQHFAGQQALASLQHDEQVLQEQMRRRQLQQLQQHPHPHMPLSSAAAAAARQPTINAESLAADSLAANATRRTSNRKRSYDRSADGDNDPPALKRQAVRKDSISKTGSTKKKKKKQRKQSDAGSSVGSKSPVEMDADSTPKQSKPKAKGKASSSTKKKPARAKQPEKPKAPPEPVRDPETMEAAEALVTADINRIDSPIEVVEEVIPRLGTIESLVEAAEAEEKVDEAATVMKGLQTVEWSDSEPEDEVIIKQPVEIENDKEKVKSSSVIPAPPSALPSLPVEPEFDIFLPNDEAGEDEHGYGRDLSSPLKDASLLMEASQNGAKPKTGSVIAATDYPYPVDTWWPSVTTIHRERRMQGEKSDEEDFVDELPSLCIGEDVPFRANVRNIQSRLAKELEPGVLEKIPHCKIHRAKIRAQKGATAPDHAFCWQVTESYCTDPMVCCSVCNTWRHARCGGHYKPVSIREHIETEEPFIPVCDLCHYESSILQNFPKGQVRLERQRIEQLRRSLATSAVIRQASFIKHGGTYKWPLGSVSTTHVGGHTRSVHSRHDKAEKQWTEMAMRLGRGYSYRPKERAKVRTRELERLLVCIEDAESFMDRHNMMQFLQHDAQKQYPAGFEKHLRNLFDPDDDDVEANGESIVASAVSRAQSPDVPEMESSRGMVGRKPPERFLEKQGEDDAEDSQDEDVPATCAREGCTKKPRFDSSFCSDSCGVSALESDLYQAFQLAGEMHPSLMRA